jgi:adenylosuccinate lyase
MATDIYSSPLAERYASHEMLALFSPDRKFLTWRRLWLALAEAEAELGLPITPAQLDELRAHLADLDYPTAAAREREVRHDVMAHLHAYACQCPLAKPILHLGATSCYVGDNTDIILFRDALALLRQRLLAAIAALADFADREKSRPTLAFTHFQPAQPTTVGKRATLWLQDLVADLADLDHAASTLLLLGSKGTTGTQASFLTLFGGDQSKVDQLDPIIARKFGFPGCYPVAGQTYPRKTDARIAAVLSGIAASAHKFANDLRLLQHLKEVEEPFDAAQVGSSAMPYKRNPMRAERMTALARHVAVNALNPVLTASEQWLERTLDDSANRRLALPELFLAADAILILYADIASGLVVHPGVIERHLRDQLPFLATENILMRAVQAGGDRQDLHERIRRHARTAAAAVYDEGRDNPLLDLIAADPAFRLSPGEIEATLDPSAFVGAAAHQTDRYLADAIRPLLLANPPPSPSPSVTL